MNLYRVRLKSIHKWERKTFTLYVIQPSIDDAREYVNLYKKQDYEIDKIYHLGFELGSRMFMGGKDDKR